MGKLLDAKTCETSKPDKTKDILKGDGDGLYLRIRPNGTKTWIIEYLFKGKRTKFTIGSYDSKGAYDSISGYGSKDERVSKIRDLLENGRLSLGQARSIAYDWKEVRKSGHDPVAKWQEFLKNEQFKNESQKTLELAESSQPTVNQVIESLMSKMMAGKKSAPSVQYRLNRIAEHIGDKKIKTVSRQDVISAIDKIAEGFHKGKTAKLLSGEVLSVTKRLFRFACVREFIESSPIERLTRNDFDARPVKRNVTLRLDEVAELWRTLDNPTICKSDPVTIAALKILVLTGQREREVTDAEWCEFDLEAGLWKLPAKRTKKERAHLIHLAPLAVKIIKDLKPITGKTPFVFASPIKDNQPIFGRSVNNALLSLFKKGALPKVTLCHVHDLRRTLISRLPDLGYEPFIGHKIANHVLPGVLAHYNHAEYMPQRESALKEWANRIESLVDGQNVVHLHRVA